MSHDPDVIFQAIQQAFFAGLEIGRAGPREIAVEMQRGVSLALDIGFVFPQVKIHLVLDVGANVGQSAHRFHRDFPYADICCFEPVPTTYTELVANTRDHLRIKTFPLAVGRQEGYAYIHVGEESALASFVVRQPNSTMHRVLMTSLDSFLALNQYSTGHVGILKIDAEGWDLEVIAGARQMLTEHRVQFVQVETTLFDSGDARFIPLPKFIDALSEHGYELYGIYDQMPHLSGRASLAYCNAVFVVSELIGLGR